MPSRKVLVFVMAGALLIAAGAALLAQSEPTALKAEKQELKIVPIVPSDPTLGAQMYSDYCAVCHGAQGKSDGPAVAFMKSPPPQLSTLANRNSGKYPALYVAGILRMGSRSHSTATINMPAWDVLFRAHNRDAHLRISNLTTYIESLQEHH
ncbi:MAG TPA: cytochrome c [Thermoanaerobaculia bacterium]